LLGERQQRLRQMREIAAKCLRLLVHPRTRT
jgi:hypothetical protein